MADVVVSAESPGEYLLSGSLIGPKGDPGLVGPTGPTGATGAQGIQGPAGPQGVPGDTGPTGNPGIDGSVWYQGAGAPSADVNEGDYYYRTSNGAIYQYISSVWTVIGNITGPTGATGPTGNTGATGPKGDKGDTGDDGDAATIAVGDVTTVDPGDPATVTNTGTSSAAVFDFDIPQGEPGATGATGSAGTAGTNGATWIQGTGIPGGGTGSNGDFFLSTDTGNVYTKTAGSWGSPIANLRTITPRVSSTTSASSVTPNVNNFDQYTYTALAANLAINAPTGTPFDGQRILFVIKDTGTTRTLTWNGTYLNTAITLPTNTPIGKWLIVGFMYIAAATAWFCITANQEA